MMYDVNMEEAHRYPRAMVFLKVEMQGSILIPPDQLVWAVILRLMADLPPESWIILDQNWQMEDLRPYW